MDAKTVRKIFEKLPSKRKQVLLRVLAGESKAKIACDVCNGSEGAVQQHFRQLYNDFKIGGHKERKLPQLIALFAKAMPELMSVGNFQGIKESQPSVSNDKIWLGSEEQKIANQNNCVDRESKFDSGEDASEDNPDVLVQRVRSHPCHNAKIQDLCRQLRILDVERPVEIDSIYIEIDVLEKLPSNTRNTISDFQSFNSDIDKSDRPDLGRTQQERVPGVDVAANNMKLIVLGEFGSGKTTFLKCLAIQCNQGRFQSQLIPIFIELKYFAITARSNQSDFSLLNYILDDFLLNCDVWEEQINTLLLNGKAFILLDGLDEVDPENADFVIREISYFVKLYFSNKFVISCRIGSQLADRLFNLNFTYVKLADFQTKQIEAFAKKWFVAVTRNSREQGLSQAAKFIEKLYLSEHQSILQLAGTPILLNLACLVFQEKSNFYSRKYKLYEEGLEILLFRWDEVKNIKRDEVYRKLPVWNKKQVLSQVAAIAFERKNYSFEKNEILQVITDSINNLTDEKNVPMQVQLESETVLKSIAEQHGLLVQCGRGIYSFSHLTFQEYFTAWRFANSFDPQLLEKLVIHITEPHWREVFLLTTEMLPSADKLMLLIKTEIDRIIPKKPKMQQFLNG
jgi:predicted NACHT family NTPase